MVKTFRPETWKEALEIRKETGALPFAGGTDLMVKFRSVAGEDPQLGEAVLFLDRIPELKVLEESDGFLVLGAAVPLTDLLTAKKPVIPEILRQALKEIAAPGLRNRATLGGNIVNASPAGDSLPPLIVLEALLVLESMGKSRRISLEDFITGPGKTILAPDEILREIRIPLENVFSPGENSRDRGRGFYYRKVGTRRANALAKLSLAALWDRKAGFFRMAAGAVGPRIVRFPAAEALFLSGKPPVKEILDLCGPLIVPIDDQRSTAAYRKKVCLNLINHCFTRYMEEL